MSFCTDQIVLLAGNIYTGINSPSAQSVGYVSGWLTQTVNLGELNNRLNTCFYFSGSGPCIGGGFGDQEASIYSLIYTMDYYEQQSLAALANGGSFWTSMSEGDTKIGRTSAVLVSKAYSDLSIKSQEALYVAVNNWKRGHTLAVSIDGTDLPSWPSP